MKQKYKTIADDVRQLHAEGLTDHAIARRLNVSQPTVGKSRRYIGLQHNHDPSALPASDELGTCGGCGRECSERHTRCAACWSRMSHGERIRAAASVRTQCRMFVRAQD